MADAKLKSTLPKEEEENGLAGNTWSRRLLDDPDKQHVAIITFQTVEEKRVFSAGTVTPIVQITRIEPVADEAEAEVLVDKLLELAAKRTGLVQLPLKETVTELTPKSSPLDFDDPDGDAA